jgi:exodeoxyribonuclease VII small subunit
VAKKKKVRRAEARPREAEPECNFEESLAELEQIVSELECGELGLEQALGRYEQGIRHLKQCHAQLARVSRRIELLSGVDAAGNPIVVPFDDEDCDSLEEKQASRGRRRGAMGAAPSPRTSVDDDPRLF